MDGVNKRVGIRTVNPDVPLDERIYDSVDFADYYRRYTYDGDLWVQYMYGNRNISIRAERGIECLELVFSSEERIKKDIVDGKMTTHSVY